MTGTRKENGSLGGVEAPAGKLWGARSGSGAPKSGRPRVIVCEKDDEVAIDPSDRAAVNDGGHG